MPFKINPFSNRLDETGASSGGTVTSVSGTVNRITSTGGATPVIDIDAAYVGQTSITTLGTVATGTWNATIIGVTKGGTGVGTLTGVLTGNGTGNVTANAVTQYGVLIGGASNAVGSTAVGSAGQILRSGGAGVNPSYSTATYPSTATGTGTLLRADGTNWSATTTTYPNTNAVSTLLYASSANVMGALATANNGLLVTSNTGVPSILAGPGATGRILQSNAAAAPSFSTATYPATAGTTGNVLTSDGANWTSSTPTSFTQAVIQVFAASGTYTPTTGMKYCIVECVGGGGGGGGCASTTSSQAAAAGGGGGGGYGRSVFTAATIGASQTVTIGAGGTAGATTPTNGGAGNNTTFGALITALGGGGGAASAASVLATRLGGAPGGISGGTVAATGDPGGHGFSIFSTTASVMSGNGGSSMFGGGALGLVTATSGLNGSRGGGGSGAASANGIARAGGTGGDGYCIITEYI
jgi:hypothetical protein